MAAQNDSESQKYASEHLLRQLRLPSRYESLVAAVGADVAQLLVEPSEATLDVFRRAALHIRSRGGGCFYPSTPTQVRKDHARQQSSKLRRICRPHLE